jgi:aminomethyltransferase
MTELKHTPLNATHRALNARMVDFGGWDMPVNYGSQIDEHRAVRTDAGMFDVSHMCVVDFTGERVRAFFEYALANNVAKLQTPGRALYSCLLNPNGGVIDDLIVYYFGEDHFRVVVNAGTADKDIAWFGQLNAEGGFGLTITPRRDYAIVAVQGPNAREKVWQTIPAARAATENLKPFNAARVDATPFGELTVARTGYTGEDGFEIIVPADHVAALWSALQAQGVRRPRLDRRSELAARLHRQGQARSQRLASRVRRPDPAEGKRQGGRRAACSSESRHAPRRRRNHQRHFFPHHAGIDRFCARAERRAAGRHRSRPDS